MYEMLNWKYFSKNMKYHELPENSIEYLEISGKTLKFQEIPRKIMKYWEISRSTKAYFYVFPFLQIPTIFFFSYFTPSGNTSGNTNIFIRKYQKISGNTFKYQENL
jgi:hypothetical protein